MQLSDKGYTLIKKYEGLRLQAYLCPANVRTIGYGHTGSDVELGMVITEDRADELLRQDAVKFEAGVSKLLKTTVTQGMFDALVSFAFNLGLGNLSSSTLLRLVNEGKYQEASQQFVRWNRAGGKVLAGLTKRRQEESQLFLL